MIDLPFDYIKRNPVQCLALLKCNVVVLSGDNYCDIVSSSQCQPCDELVSDQEEADTKVVLHVMRFLSENKEESVCIRSPSGDILVIALGRIIERSRVVFDYGNGIDRRQIWLNELKFPVDLRQALIGFHALTGNDYVSSFFLKGKGTCWDIMKDDKVIVEALTQLGQSCDLSEDIEKVLEKFVCKLYGSRKNSVNEVRFQLFERKQKKESLLTCHYYPQAIQLFICISKGQIMLLGYGS